MEATLASLRSKLTLSAAHKETGSVTEAVTPLPPLLVFADDWGRHPSSCQHLIRHFLGRCPVYWVNTIMRPPRLNLETLGRGFEKLRHWTRRRHETTLAVPSPGVLNPKMSPWFGSPLGRRLNRLLLTRQLLPVLRSLPSPPIAITTLPIVADVMETLPVRRWVYYCVDDFSEWPGLDKAALEAMELPLARRADVLIAVSTTLQDRLARMGRKSHLLTHGVDLDHWRRPAAAIPELDRLEAPFVVFWGVIDRRMDVEFVRRLAAELTKGTILLVGPESDPDPALFVQPRVVRLPPLPYEQLPTLGLAAAVMVMPYADLPVTRAIQPLKLKEYLATGKPTVVRDLPANLPWADCLDLVNTPEMFSQAVQLRLETGLPHEQALARARLDGEGWAVKSRTFLEWMLGPVSEPHR
jgi:glycosyltransferase involved in cell wall biosynthesis